MIEKLIIVSGNQIGAPHKRKGSNNMDAYAIQRGRGCNVVGVADGSGGTGVYSESYAEIMINWLTLRFRVLIENLGSQYNGAESIKDIGAILWSEYQSNLTKLLNIAFDGIPPGYIDETLSTDGRDRRVKYADEFMLHTAMLLITILNTKTGNWDAYSLYKGDGFIVKNSEVIHVDKINPPKHSDVMYPALGMGVYHGRLRSEVEKIARAGFEFIALGSSGIDWNRIALASDGLRFVMPDMYDEIIYPYINPDLNQKDRDNAIGTAIFWAIKDRRLSLDDDLALISIMTQSYIDNIYLEIEEAQKRQAELDAKNELRWYPDSSSSTPISQKTPGPSPEPPITQVDLPPVNTEGDNTGGEGNNYV